MVTVSVASVETVTHGVDGGVGVNLQRVDVVTGILEQAVVRVQHLMGQQVEPLPVRHTGRRGRGWKSNRETNQLDVCAVISGVVSHSATRRQTSV